MGLNITTVLTLIASSLAAFFTFLEQKKGKKSWQSYRLWLALLFMIVTIAAIIVESTTSTAQDKERRADLLLIQKQNSALNAICIELNLDKSNTYDEEMLLQFHTYLSAVSSIVQTNLIAEYLILEYIPDRGWKKAENFTDSWPSVNLAYNKENNTLRFEFVPFGVRCKGNLLWQAERIADISLVRLGIQLSLGTNPLIPQNPTSYNWCPINNIKIYANTYDMENLITILTPHHRSYGDTFDIVYFHPETQKASDTDWFNFYIDLYQMRNNILNSNTI
ncbi:MAG: hypothetical protein ABIJ45_14670 [Candidatus Zixiibacteriota bacterium]